MRAIFAAAAMLLLVVVPAAAGPAEDLAQLLEDYDEDGLRLYPSGALWRGEERYLDRYEENLADAHLAERRALNAAYRARLDAIPRGGLSYQDGLSHDIFAWQLGDDADGLALSERFRLIPLNQFYGEHQSFAREMQWQSRFPFRTAAHYDKAVARMNGFARWMDQAIARMREGIAQGVVQPRVVVERMIPQVEAQANKSAEESVFYTPVKNLPDTIKGAERRRVTAAYAKAVGDVVLPAYRRLAEFLAEEYLPASRGPVGLSAMPGGKEMYLYLVKSTTTTALTPDEIHAIGLEEVARIAKEMERVKKATGFEGTLAQFRAFLRSDPRFKFKDEAAVLAEYERIKAQIMAHVGALFGTLAKTGFEIKFFEPFIAPTKASAEYNSPSADGARPGIFWVNSYDLPSRPTYTTEVLESHEAVPGHHQQITVAIENKSLPEFRRFGGPTAYVEGWGLYSESLGKELGLYTDPYQDFGRLSFDMWRACRLVVDTGMHWKGWTREQAIQYLLDNTSLTETDVVAEIERYIAIPGQALAYKIGQLNFLALRAKAEKELGDKFDIRRFHDALLLDGGMPIAILNAKIEGWIAAEKAGG